ncbi:hypothetical protein BC940DRAFT_321872 [Gongronella butleri]|nr:hypothetical protein BC940DRAFT_321872 [Gongronella butleri]
MNTETQLTVLNKVVERMTDCYLPTGDVDPQSLAPLLTNANATAQDHEDLMADHYLVNDQEMVRILGLQEVHENQVVLLVIAGNLSAKAEIKEVEDWVDHLVMTRNGHEVENLHVRYVVGMCTGPNTPWGRVEQDAGQAGGLMGHFLDALQAIEDDDHVQFAVYVLPITIHRAQANQRQLDKMEQILIDYFDLNKLLNQQSGGFRQYYSPSQEEIDAHNDQYPTILQTLIRRYRHPVNDDHVHNALAAWHQDLSTQMQQDHGIAQVMAELTAQNQDNDYMIMVLEQATPSWSVYNRTLFCTTLGDACPYEGVENRGAIFSGQSRAGHVALLSFARAYNLTAVDDDFADDDKTELDIHSRDVVPMVNLYPWPPTIMRPDLALNQLTSHDVPAVSRPSSCRVANVRKKRVSRRARSH